MIGFENNNQISRNVEIIKFQTDISQKQCVHLCTFYIELFVYVITPQQCLQCLCNLLYDCDYICTIYIDFDFICFMALFLPLSQE